LALQQWSGAECLEEQEDEEAREIREMVERDRDKPPRPRRSRRLRFPRSRSLNKTAGAQRFRSSRRRKPKTQQTEEDKEECRKIQAEKDAATKETIDDVRMPLTVSAGTTTTNSELARE
jgi:hypothetical protein